MASFLTALANIGSQYAEGTTAGKEEKEKLAQERARTGLEQTQQELERNRLEFEKQREAQRVKEVQSQPNILWVDVGKGQKLPWSITQQKFVKPDEIPGYTDPTTKGMLGLQAWIGTQPKEDYAPLTQAAVTYAGMGDAPLDIFNKLQGIEKTRQAERDKQQKATSATSKLNPVVAAEAGLPPKADDYPGGTADPQFQLDSQQWGQKAEKILARLAGSASGARAQATQEVKTKFMNTQERQLWEQLKTVDPMVDRLKNFIESHNLQNENGLIFGDRSALRQHLRYQGYTFGSKQEPITQELIKDAASIQVMGAAPWMRLGRGKYTLEMITPHLPRPTDTPANLYDKIIWLQENVLQDARNSLEGLAPPGGQGAGGQPSGIPAPAAPARTDVPSPAAPAGGRDPNNPMGLDLTPR